MFDVSSFQTDVVVVVVAVVIVAVDVVVVVVSSFQTVGRKERDGSVQ